MTFAQNFVGIDEAAFGDGSADSQPVDTALQRRFQNNIQQCYTQRVSHCFSPVISNANSFTTFAGIRPYASGESHTVWLGLIPVSESDTGVSLTLAYHSQTPGSATNAGTIELLIRFADGSETEATLATTYSSGTTTGHQSVHCYFAQPVPENGLMGCEIWAYSKQGTSLVGTGIGSAGTGATSNMFYREPFTAFESQTGANRFWWPNSSGTAPDADSLEAMVLECSGSLYPDATSPGRRDLLFTQDTGAGTMAHLVQPTPTQLSPGTAESGTAYMHQCLMLRAISWRPIRGTVTDFYATHAIIEREKFAPNIIFDGDAALSQMELIRQAYFQPRLAFIGPRGRKIASAAASPDLDALDYFGYAAHWPFVKGDWDGSTTGEERDLINDVLELRTENPVIEINCTWLSLQHGAPFNINANAGSSGNFKAGTGSSAKTDKRAVPQSEGAGSADWDFTITIDQMDDVAAGLAAWTTNSTTYGTASDTRAIPVWGADVTGNDRNCPPVLRGSDSMDQVAKGGGASPGFWFREGSLYQADLAAGLLHDTTHIVEISGMPSATTMPFRLKVEAALNDFTDPVKEDVQTADQLNQSLRLVLVSCTVIERPVEP